MAHVAFTTFAVLKHPYPHEGNDAFNELEPLVFGASETAPGFVARATAVDTVTTKWTNFGRDYGDWGMFAAPAYYTGGRDDDTDTRASTLSVWQDLESVYAYAYSDLHLHALRNRREWFVALPHRLYAAWWLPEGTVPTWQDACDRLARIDTLGSTPEAFDFRQAYDETGAPYQVRRPRTAPAA
ncbi:DUF3291 domain-containing protein [Streptomyces sp. NPDC060194]|uniref:DUF3291 domain-containing protein n=1 Tax=Streptomyces sp. NPDC060194 TaxID=3347069 RepID=UPI0036679DA8